VPADRPSIAMSAQQVSHFLTSSEAMVVAVCDSAGWPVGGMARAVYDGTVVSLVLDPGDPLAAEMAAGIPVCCVAEQSTSYYEIKGAIAHGAVISVETAADHTVAVKATIERVSSFDFGRLRPCPAPEPPAAPSGAWRRRQQDAHPAAVGQHQSPGNGYSTWVHPNSWRQCSSRGGAGSRGGLGCKA
jgi:hypothetical protein